MVHRGQRAECIFPDAGGRCDTARAQLIGAISGEPIYLVWTTRDCRSFKGSAGPSAPIDCG
jgi:hypothetical protein